MTKRKGAFVLASLLLAVLTAGCGRATQNISNRNNTEPSSEVLEPQALVLSSDIIKLTDNFSAVEFIGDDGFEEFLAAGGASTDFEVVEFLTKRLLADFDIISGLFGCSTIAVKNPNDEQLFGRNFDWQSCEALVVSSQPKTGYASISTVNMDFISQNAGGAINAALSVDEIRTMAALFAPLDGMNEMGLAVSVNMIEDSATIEQSTSKPDITTTTAIRLLLNKAANVDEALLLLEQYDMHASMGMMIHFALADKAGRSVVVEYIDNEMVVTQTPVVTNFYLAQGNKNGIGSAQSHERYDILMQALANSQTMSMQSVAEALDSVSKDNFDEFASTEWSIVFNLNSGIAHYYHRENYETRYTFKINKRGV